MRNKSDEIRSAVSLIAMGFRRHDKLQNQLSRGKEMSRAEQLEFNDFPTSEVTGSFEFLIGNFLVDIHTIALAHAPAVERG